MLCGPLGQAAIVEATDGHRRTSGPRLTVRRFLASEVVFGSTRVAVFLHGCF